MLKSKKIVLYLFLLCVACFSAWALITFTPAKAVNGADIVIFDDFTQTTFIEGENDVLHSHAYEHYNVSSPQGFAEEGLGLIPCAAPSKDLYITGDGYIVYKVQADEGFFLNEFILDLTTYVSHCSNGAYIGYDKTNIKAYVATESLAFTQVFAHCPTGAGGEYLGDASITSSKATDTRIDLTSYVAGATTAYIKIELLHLTFEEIKAATTSYLTSFVDPENGFVKRLGVSLQKVKISATQTAEGIVTTDVSISDDYTTTKIADSTNIVEYNHLLSWPDGHGALPTDVWNAYINTDDAYAVYKISAQTGSTLKDIKVSLGLGLGTSGGLYNWWSGNMDNANVYLDVSTDGGNTYQQVYDVLNDQTYYRTVSGGEVVNPFKSGNYDENGNAIANPQNLEALNKITPNISLSAYSGEEVYVRVRIKHPTPAETYEGYASTGIPMGRSAVQYYGITISAKQETIPVIPEKEDTSGKFVVEDDFQNLLQGVTAWKQNSDTSGLTTYNYGSTVHGLVPASTWGATVDTADGYIVYNFPLNGNGVAHTLKDLKLSIKALLNGKNYSGAVAVSYGFDGDSYTEISRTTTAGISSEAPTTINCDLNTALLSEEAKEAKNLYVKVAVEHTTASGVPLQNVAVKLLDVKFTGKSNFVMTTGASLRLSNQGNGLKYTTLIDKEFYNNLIADGYEVLFGTVIMPYSYIAQYGELNVENLFTENAKYCWGTAVQGKTLILNGTAIIDEDYNQDYHSYNYSIVNILEENLDTKFVARGYLRLKKDGVETFMMADYAQANIKQNACSITSVAYSVVGANANNAQLVDIRNNWLEDVKGTTASYTVKHVYISGSDIAEVVVQNYVGKTGEVLSANVNAKTGYVAVNSLTLQSGKSYQSSVTGTVLLDGSLELVRYYVKNA